MTEQTRTIELTAIPGMPGMLARAATTRKKAQREPAFPPLVITAGGIRADTAKLAKFSRVCGFAASDELPLTYPHIMAFPWSGSACQIKRPLLCLKPPAAFSAVAIAVRRCWIS